MIKNTWTTEEISILTIEYGKLGPDILASKLNRTVSSVKSKASRLHLVFPENKTERYMDKLVHKGILDHWPIEEYISDSVNIIHECINGHTWNVRPSSIVSGTGCPHCKGTIARTPEQYECLLISRGIKPLSPYKNANHNIEHLCTNGHVWSARPSSILSGSGCPACNKTGFNPELPGLLYYCKIVTDKQIYYKIGITNRPFKDRFNKDSDKDIVLLISKLYRKGLTAKKVEKMILNKYKDYRIKVPNLLKSGGNTELFLCDIREL